MKKVVFLFLLIGLFACKKDTNENGLNKEIIGTWELAKTSGFLPTVTYPYGNGNIITLKENGVYERMENNQVVFTGKYSIRKKKDCYERNTSDILFTNENGWQDYHYISIEEAMLTLSTPNCLMDGSTAYYRRLQ